MTAVWLGSPPLAVAAAEADSDTDSPMTDDANMALLRQAFDNEDETIIEAVQRRKCVDN